MSVEPTSAKVIPFPRQLRMVAAVPPVELVEHDGQVYRLADLLERLSPGERQAIEQTAPRTSQATWDEAVRRWPALTAEIVAACQVVA